MLAKTRREARRALHRDLAGPDDVYWSPRDVTELEAGVPDRFPASYGVVVQPHDHDLILNAPTPGTAPW